MGDKSAHPDYAKPWYAIPQFHDIFLTAVADVPEYRQRVSSQLAHGLKIPTVPSVHRFTDSGSEDTRVKDMYSFTDVLPGAISPSDLSALGPIPTVGIFGTFFFCFFVLFFFNYRLMLY